MSAPVLATGRATARACYNASSGQPGGPMFKEFRDFALRGNVFELAVAVVLGAAFGRIVTSLVDDVLMPPLGLAFGGMDFRELFFDLSRGGYATLAQAEAAGAPVIRYG